MKALVLALGLALAAAPALAETIAPADAQAHVGQTLTVEGTVDEVHTDSRSGVTFLNLGGQFPRQAFTGVIFADDLSRFLDVSSLVGKVVDITGPVQDYKKSGRIEIILHDPTQLRVK
jgi:hypothetical protein